MTAEDPTDQVRRALRVLADLAPTTEGRSPRSSVPTEWFQWLPARAVYLFAPPAIADAVTNAAGSVHLLLGSPEDPRAEPLDRRFGEQLAAVDQIRPEQRSLRAGWLFVAGSTVDADGRARRVFLPLVTVPVRVHRSPVVGDARLLPAGDVEITDLVEDEQTRRRLEQGQEFGGGALADVRSAAIPPALLARLDRLRRFALETARAAGLATSDVVPADLGPDQLLRAEGLRVVAGVGVFAIHQADPPTRSGSLRAWASGPLDRWTAFHSLYADAPQADGPPVPSASEVHSPYLLTPVQRRAVVESRTSPITLVSGAPGTGKSHTVVAIACDALARGESVLLAARSDATVDALRDLLERAPGPDPVLFGSDDRREALAGRLAAGELQPLDDDDLDRARVAADHARQHEREVLDRIHDALGAERLLELGELGGLGGLEQHGDADERRLAPNLFETTADLDAIDALLRETTVPARGWWARRRQRRRLRALREKAGSPAHAAPTDIARALRVARSHRIAVRLAATGGLEIGSAWEELLRRTDDANEQTARWLAAACRSSARLNRSTLPAIAALATALRSGRAARRDQLSRLQDDRLTTALPLWLGSLPDIDDLLPRASALFDLVILDEASSIDQSLAAPALLRARRGVIVGDPRQLRHVSFVSDERTRSAVEIHGLSAQALLAARLDVRRNSAFDVAAAVTPSLVLEEHFRSDPHLVDFVAARLYGGAVEVATRAPSTTDRDCVDVVRIEGRREKSGAVGAEIDWTIRELRRLRRAGADSVGVITPFRAQADALEEAVLAHLGLDDLEAMDLRVGTVHAFQGNERDVVIASLAIGAEEPAARWRFVEDPHLFCVLVTRARKRLTLLLSAEPPAGGLVADYVDQADAPPGPPPSGPPESPWAAAIADDLRSGGCPVVTSYPTGRHHIDLCVAAEVDTAIECGVHPDGPAAHIDRHLALRRAGWRILEAYPSKWGDRRGELIVELLRQLRRIA